MVKIIKSDAQYDLALNRRGELNDIIADAPGGSVKKELEELEVLSLVISKYENENYPEGIRLRMQDCPFKHDQKDLVVDMHRERGYFIFCKICQASGPYGKDKLEGIENWNNRKKIP